MVVLRYLRVAFRWFGLGDAVAWWQAEPRNGAGSRLVRQSILLCVTAVAGSQPALQLASQTIIEDDGGGMAGAANRMVGGIVSYVGWPNGRGAAGRSLCQVGTPRLASNPVAPQLPSGRHLRVRRVTAARSEGRRLGRGGVRTGRSGG